MKQFLLNMESKEVCSSCGMWILMWRGTSQSVPFSNPLSSPLPIKIKSIK